MLGAIGAIAGAAIAALIANAITAHSGGIFGGGSSDVSSPTKSHTTAQSANANPLRVVFQPVALQDYAVAFDHDIGLPQTSEQWESLHARGGIDIGTSAFRLTLANHSEAPLTVTNIEAVMHESKSVPTGSLASVYTQGAESIEEFGVALNSATIGATAPLHRVENREQTVYDPTGLPIFFRSHDIALAPNEIYEAKVEIVTDIAKLLEYSFVVTGSTASGPLSYHSPSFNIAGYGSAGEHKGFGHEYWMLSESSSQRCWVRAYRAVTFPRCPGPPVIYEAGYKPQRFYPSNRTLVSGVHWLVWSKTRAVGVGTTRSCGVGGVNCTTTQQSIVYTQPRQACGVTTFTQFRYSKWPTRGELSVSAHGNLCIWYTSG
jgi:hypothetical protein